MVLAKAEVQAVLGELSGQYRLMAELLYEAGCACLSAYVCG